MMSPAFLLADLTIAPYVGVRGQTARPERVITLTVTETVRADPVGAEILFLVTGTGETLEKAWRNCEATRAEVKRALERGVGAEVKMADIGAMPLMTRYGGISGEGRRIGYRVWCVLLARLSAFPPRLWDLVRKAVKAAVEAGALLGLPPRRAVEADPDPPFAPSLSIKLIFSNPEELVREALSRAIEKAKGRAEAIAKPLGERVRLVSASIAEIRIGGVPERGPRFEPGGELLTNMAAVSVTIEGIFSIIP